MTSAKRQNYTDEFKEQAVETCYSRFGGNVSKTASALGVSKSTLNHWCKKRRGASSGSVREHDANDSRAELERALKEIKRLEMENDFLKKASAYFAKHAR